MEDLLKKTITFPVNAGTKVPAVKGWPRLAESVAAKRGQGLGALCGEKGGFFVVDCDLLKSDAPESFVAGTEAWLDLVGEMPAHVEYPQVRTRSGGLHAYFAWDPRVKSSVQRYRVCDLFEGEADDRTVKIDIIADGRYIVCPPTPGYAWLHNSQYVSPPPMPRELLDLLFPEPADVDRARALCTTFRNVDKATLAYVVEGIPARRADVRDEWMRVVWAVADTAAKNGYDALDVADAFSRRSHKYAGPEDVEAMYRQSNGAVTFGTLVHFSERGLPRDEGSVTLKNTDLLTSDLKAFDDKVERIDDFEVNGNVINLVCGDLKIRIDINNLAIYVNGQYRGHLKTGLEFENDLSFIHKHFSEGGGSIFHMNENRTDLVSRGQYGENRIKFMRNGKQKHYILMENGRNVGTRSKKADINHLEQLIVDTNQRQMAGYNILNQNNVNVFNITNNFYFDEDNLRSDDQIIDALVRSHPSIVDHFKFCSRDYGSFNGIYLFGPHTGIWRKEHNATVNKMLTTRIKKYVPMLTEKETKYCETQKNKAGLRMAFIEHIVDNDFESKIDENLDVFATANCVYDVGEGALRKARPHDFVYTNTGWDYDERAADEHLPAVREFFERVFPVAQERDVVVTYLASLIHGYRTDKKLLAFTDKRNGNNGKTTLMTLLRTFFGDYTKTNNNFFLKGAFAKDKDAHDGGTATLKGKRLLICDELKKSMRLDEGTVKNITGGANQELQGRRMGKEDVFRLTVQCGVILIFNEGDCPKFDATDNAFMERLVIVPFRSKFVGGEADPDTYTFQRDCNISDKFKLWRSALLKHFISHCRKNGIADMEMPSSMVDWKNEILEENNVVAEWLWDAVRPQEGSFVQLAELRERYKKDHPHERAFKNKDIERMINSAFNAKGAYVKDHHNYYIDGARKQGRRVYLNFADC
ncbi:DNA polymerase/primase [Diadromus pulchellus ascovirus 4a]|uniref:Complete DpAV4 genome n=1 Tax=Diadromus pulchellus ascovirus 4a TaxID=158683 RepID=F2NZ19_9VIRU|nr:DNA polymerase/primase [Diadromus pulchellus ascovirus 4a]CCA61447.1 unnamed protein product [Diadromus pulchellus ascovirus 4a]